MTEKQQQVFEKTRQVIEASRALRERQLARRRVLQMALDPSQPRVGQMHFVFEKPVAVATSH